MEAFDNGVLIKVSCILASCIATHVTWSPPVQPRKKEQIPPKDLLERFMNFTTAHIWVIRLTWWMIGISEIAAIVLLIVAPSSRHSLVGAPRLELSGSTLLGVVLMTLGAGLRYVCYKAMSSHFTFELSIQEKHKLVTAGPYGVVRHPGYSGFVMVYAGLLLWHGSRGSWLRESGLMSTLVGKVLIGVIATVPSIILFALLSRVSKEDEKLKEVFGKEWGEYAQRVPYVLVPGLL